MSVPLINIRIEIEDQQPLLTRIHYTAPKKTALTEPKLILDTMNKDDKKRVKARHRGSRKLEPIKVDSYEPSTRASSEPDASESSASSHDRTKTSQIQFYSGNPTVERTNGIIHLFKENKRTSLDSEAERSTMVCILAVPTSMTVHELIQFTAPFNENLQFISIIRDQKPNQYMVLLRFRSQKSADEFYSNYNGIQFNSIEPEICNLVYVARVESVYESQAGFASIAGHTELPTCAVCLERMDESVEGIIKILCDHRFHADCIDKWSDLSCPVCRFCQIPETVEENSCFECKSRESLWICLICGHIGCGRYLEGHAYKHYCETQHTYAMQLDSNNRVWDYAGDNYVHRLLQNKTDGKPVEVQQCAGHQCDEKVDSVQLEYTYLLTSQLETQRRYFEETKTRIESDCQAQLHEIIEINKSVVDERDQLLKERDSHTRERINFEKKLTQMSTKLNKTIGELKEERVMNKVLRENQDLWQQKLSESENKMKNLMKKFDDKEKEIEELKEQVRDLMFFFDAQNKIANCKEISKEEIESGHIVVGESASSGVQSGKTRKIKKK